MSFNDNNVANESITTHTFTTSTNKLALKAKLSARMRALLSFSLPQINISMGLSGLKKLVTCLCVCALTSEPRN